MRTDPDAAAVDLPMDTSRALFHFNDHVLTYAGHFRHDEEQQRHSHSFVEIAFVLSGEGVHRSVAGLQPLAPGDVILMQPGLWHGYDECRRLALYNCCFSSELLHRELAWTREDPMLGYLLRTGPCSDSSGGMLTVHLEPETLADCRTQLTALEALWQLPVQEYHGDIIGQLALLLSTLARAVARVSGSPLDEVDMTHPAVGHAMQLLETRLADRWTVTELADELYLAPGYLTAAYSRPPLGCRQWPTWPACAPSAPRTCCCIPRSRSPASAVRSGGQIRTTLPAASWRTTASAPPRTGPVLCALRTIRPQPVSQQPTATVGSPGRGELRLPARV